MVHALAQRGIDTIAVDVQIIDPFLEVVIQYGGSQETEPTESGEARLRLWAAGKRVNLLGGECLVSSQRPGGSALSLRIPVASLERASAWSA